MLPSSVSPFWAASINMSFAWKTTTLWFFLLLVSSAPRWFWDEFPVRCRTEAECPADFDSCSNCCCFFSLSSYRRSCSALILLASLSLTSCGRPSASAATPALLDRAGLSEPAKSLIPSDTNLLLKKQLTISLLHMHSDTENHHSTTPTHADCQFPEFYPPICIIYFLYSPLSKDYNIIDLLSVDRKRGEPPFLQVQLF